MFYFHYQELFVSNNTSHNPLLLNKPFMVMLLFGIFFIFFRISDLFCFSCKKLFQTVFNWFVHRSFEIDHKYFKTFDWFVFLLFYSKLKITLINSIIIITKTTQIFSSTVNRES